MIGKDYEAQDCSLARALEVIGERWTLLIVRDAFYGVRRFNDFQGHLDIPRAVLSDRLHGLLDHGILEASPDPDHGGRRLYDLTARGRELWPVLHSLLVWGAHHCAPGTRAFTHAECDTELQADGSCPACRVTPPPQEILTVPRGDRASRRDDPVAVALRAPHRLLVPLPTHPVSARGRRAARR